MISPAGRPRLPFRLVVAALYLKRVYNESEEPVADHNGGPTEFVFIIHGAMLHLDAQGQVTAVGDAASYIRDWAQALREEGKVVPEIIVGGQAGVLQL